MYAITKYTSTQAILASSGLTENEISHEDIQDQGLEDALLVELADWLPDHEVIWSEFTANGASVQQVLKGRLLKQYARWFCSARVIGTYLSIPARIFDGKSDMRRFSELDLVELRKRAEGTAASYKARLLKIVNPTDSGSSFPLVGLSKPTKDPVTGSGI